MNRTANALWLRREQMIERVSCPKLSREKFKRNLLSPALSSGFARRRGGSREVAERLGVRQSSGAFASGGNGCGQECPRSTFERCSFLAGHLTRSRRVCARDVLHLNNHAF
jgi:hypothetical protein